MRDEFGKFIGKIVKDFFKKIYQDLTRDDYTLKQFIFDTFRPKPSVLGDDKFFLIAWLESNFMLLIVILIIIICLYKLIKFLIFRNLKETVNPTLLQKVEFLDPIKVLGTDIEAYDLIYYSNDWFTVISINKFECYMVIRNDMLDERIELDLNGKYLCAHRLR